MCLCYLIRCANMAFKNFILDFTTWSFKILIHPLIFLILSDKFKAVTTKLPTTHGHRSSWNNLILINWRNKRKRLHCAHLDSTNSCQVSSCSIFRYRIALKSDHLIEILVPHHSEETIYNNRYYYTRERWKLRFLVKDHRWRRNERKLVLILYFLSYFFKHLLYKIYIIIIYINI